MHISQILQIHAMNTIRRYCCHNRQETRIMSSDSLTADRTLIFRSDVTHNGFCGYEAVAKVFICTVMHFISKIINYFIYITK